MLRFVHTRNVGLAISISDAISVETLLSFQIATAGDSDKHVMFPHLCKHHFKCSRAQCHSTACHYADFCSAHCYGSLGLHLWVYKQANIWSLVSACRKHSSLLKKCVNYFEKQFCKIGSKWWQSTLELSLRSLRLKNGATTSSIATLSITTLGITLN
jgi:hypothetical protein